MNPPDRLVVEHHGCVAVARIRDARPDQSAVVQIHEELARLLLDHEVNHVVIDFSGVVFFEANLRGELIRLWRALQARGGKLALCGLSTVDREHPTMVQFGRIMEISDHLEDALIRIQGGPP